MLQVELHVPDFKVVEEFYGKLGFKKVKPLKNDPEYLVMAMGNNILRFWPGNNRVKKHDYFSKFPAKTPSGNGVELVVMVDDIEAYYSRVKGQTNVVEPLKRQPWGLLDFRVVDPNGYYLRFTTPHSVV